MLKNALPALVLALFPTAAFSEEMQSSSAQTQERPFILPVELIEDESSIDRAESARQTDLENTERSIAIQEAISSANQQLARDNRRLVEINETLVRTTNLGNWLLIAAALISLCAVFISGLALRDARRATDRELRPWVGYGGSNIYKIYNEEVGPRLMLRIVVTNAGRTPAFQFSAQYNRIGSPMFNSNVEGLDWSYDEGVLFPNTQMDGVDIAFGYEDIIASAQNPIVIRVSCRYKVSHLQKRYRYTDLNIELSFIGPEQFNAHDLIAADIDLRQFNLKVSNRHCDNP